MILENKVAQEDKQETEQKAIKDVLSANIYFKILPKSYGGHV